MSAKKLISIMAAKGYSIGRYKPGIYYYTYVGYNGVITQQFTGNWQAFVKFCSELPNAK